MYRALLLELEGILVTSPRASAPGGIAPASRGALALLAGKGFNRVWGREGWIADLS